MAALGEFGLIAALSGWLRYISPADPRALVGIGDDAAVLAAPDGRVVASTDFLLEGRHFRRDWSGALAWVLTGGCLLYTSDAADDTP